LLFIVRNVLENTTATVINGATGSQLVKSTRSLATAEKQRVSVLF